MMPLPTTWMRSSASRHQRSKRRVVDGVPERRDVVRERVEPDVDHLRRIARHRDAPAAGALAGAGHADVVEPAAQHGEHLVAAGLGLDAQRAGRDRGLERLAVAREAEEPVALDDVLQRRGVLGAAAVDQLVGAEERLAAGAVAALVVALVEVAGGRAGAPQPLDAGAVAGVDAGADEVVVRELERLAERGEALRRARRRTPATGCPAASAARTFLNAWSSVPLR